MIRLEDIDRSSRVPLSDQLVKLIRREIISGKFEIGDVLPGFREVASTLKVSEKVSRQAFDRLARDGWIVKRRGVGSVVIDNCDLRSRGRVLIVNCNLGIGYYSAILLGTLRMHLETAGYLLNEVWALNGHGKPGGGTLKRMLSEHWELIIEHGCDAVARKIIEASGNSFVRWDYGFGTRLDPEPDGNCVGCIAAYQEKAIPDFIRACARKNVHAVWQFAYGGGFSDVTERCRAFGVSVRTVNIPKRPNHAQITNVSYRNVKSLLQRERGRLPDVIFFSDDCIATGGLFAIQELGIRVPEDVAVVSHVNKQIGLVWPKSLTRLEMDPVNGARMISKAVIDYLRFGRPVNLDIGAVWVPGETF